MLPDLPPAPPPQLAMTLELKRSNIVPGANKPPTAQCFIREAERNDIDPFVLLAVLRTEGGRPGEYALNRNGTYDLGPMSVNTVWLPTLAKRYRMSESEIKQKLASDGCTNVAAAAWILKSKIVQTGNVWEGVAHFHSANPVHQGPYLMRVYSRLSEIKSRMVSAEARLRTY